MMGISYIDGKEYDLNEWQLSYFPIVFNRAWKTFFEFFFFCRHSLSSSLDFIVHKNE